MAIPNSFKEKYSLSGPSYPSERADAALSDLFAVSGRLYNDKCALKEELERVCAERDALRARVAEMQKRLAEAENARGQTSRLESETTSRLDAIERAVSDVSLKICAIANALGTQLACGGAADIVRSEPFEPEAQIKEPCDQTPGANVSSTDCETDTGESERDAVALPTATELDENATCDIALAEPNGDSELDEDGIASDTAESDAEQSDNAIESCEGKFDLADEKSADEHLSVPREENASEWDKSSVCGGENDVAAPSEESDESDENVAHEQDESDNVSRMLAALYSVDGPITSLGDGESHGDAQTAVDEIDGGEVDKVDDGDTDGDNGETAAADVCDVEQTQESEYERDVRSFKEMKNSLDEIRRRIRNK